MQLQNVEATNTGWAARIKRGRGVRERVGREWDRGSCPALDLQMLARPVLLVAK